MRPSPNEVVHGVRRVLGEAVRPAIHDEYACARLDEIRAVLAQVDWDDAGLRLLREHRQLVDLVERLQATTGRDSPLPETVPVAPPETFDELIKARAALDAWVVENLDALNDAAALRADVEVFYLG